MEISSQIIILIIGFVFGSGVVGIFYYFTNYKKKLEYKDYEDITSLKNHMQSIQQSLQNFNLAQDRIENTLIRGGAQQQGPWGEFVLKNILDSVGLREGKEYETQKGLRDNEGNLQKPDVIVHMPGKRDIIIDSKVSLGAWHDYSNTKDEINKQNHLKKFLDAVKIFVRDLSKDDYANLYEVNTIDNVLMFVPIEPALLTLYNEGNLQKPDVIVHMPGKRDIIIDSKVSLSAWHDYSNTKDEINKQNHLKKFLDAVKIFVRDLSKDDYANLYEVNTIDNVLMFVPIEPALLTLYNEGVKIIEEAWQKKIIIVGPSTLPFLLKAIENMWRLDKQTKTIKDIAATATEIYDKTVNVYESFIKANESIDKAKVKMDEAKLRLQDGPGSLTKKVEKMKKLGRLNTKKELPGGMEDDIN